MLLNVIQDSGIQNFKNDLNLAFCVKHSSRKFIKAYIADIPQDWQIRNESELIKNENEL